MTTLRLLGLIAESLSEATAAGFWRGRNNECRAAKHDVRWKTLQIEIKQLMEETDA